MIRSGWAITATWPMRSERGGRMLRVGTNALASSIVLALRPRPDDAPTTDRRGLIAALHDELPDALRKLQQGAIAPVDLPQAAIGPGMAVFSRYAKVIENDGTTMTVRSALARINEILDQVLNEQEGDFDAATRFAIAWYRQHGYATGKFGVADDLARARNTAVETMVRDGILTSAAGKVTLLSPANMPEDYDVARRRPRRRLGGAAPPDRVPGARRPAGRRRVPGERAGSAPTARSTPSWSRSSRSCCSRSPRRTAGRRTRSRSTPSRPRGRTSCRPRARRRPARASRPRSTSRRTDRWRSPTATASARCSSCSRRRSTTSSPVRSPRSCPRATSWTALVALKDKKKGIDGKEYDRLDPQVQLRMLTENIPHNLKPGWYPFDDAIGRVGQGVREGAARGAQRLGAQQVVQRRRRLPLPGHRRAAAGRDRRAVGRRRGQGDPAGPAPPDRRQGRPEGAEVGGGHARVGGAAAVARGPCAPRRRRDRQLPGRRVRRRPLQGRRDRGRGQGLRRAGPVLRAHLPDRGPARPDRPRGAAAGRRPERLAGHQPADELRRRQDALDARAVAPGVRHAARRLPAGRPGAARRDAVRRAGRRRPARRARRQPHLAVGLGQGRRDAGQHDLGRARLAARRQGGVRDGRDRGRRPHPAREGAARAAQRLRAGGDPDRRVGRLRAQPRRPRRPRRRDVRRPVHLRAVADRGGQGHAGRAAGDLDPRVGERRRRRAGRRQRRGGRRRARPRGAQAPAERRAARRRPVAARVAERGVPHRPPAAVRHARRRRARVDQRDRPRLRRDVPPARRRLPARGARRQLRGPHQADLPDPPGAVRPALRGLVEPRAVPAHARRAAADEHRHPRAVGRRGPVAADHARRRSRSGPRR